MSTLSPKARHGTQSGKAANATTEDGGARPSWSVGSTPTRVTRTLCVGWALACPSGCNPPASCIAGSTPARRTRQSARSSSGSGYWPLMPVTRVQIPHGSKIRPSGATGRHATLRTSCPSWAWEFNSPLGQCRRGRRPTGFHKAGMPGSLPGSAIANDYRRWASAQRSLISLDRKVRHLDRLL